MKKIHFNSPEAATRKTVTSWVSNGGFLYGEDERAARYAGSTHRDCGTCPTEVEKNRIYCGACLYERNREKFQAMPFKEWDGKEPIVIFRSDDYFFNKDDLRDFVDYHKDDISEIEFCICAPQYADEICPDEYYCDSLAPDHYLSDCAPELIDKFEELNKYIRENKIILSWVQGKFRTSITMEQLL